MSRAATATDVQPIDRLEEKVRQLVRLIDTLRGERAKATDEITRLTRELDAIKARLAESAGLSNEVTTLRQERDLVRDRVAQMIAQLDTLDL
jgi:seryl-tRNA synthetase